MAARATQPIIARIKDAVLSPEYGVKTVHFWGPLANWGMSTMTICVS